MKFKSLVLISASLCTVLLSCKKDSTSPESTPNPYIPVQGIDAEVYSFKEVLLGMGNTYEMNGAIFYPSTITGSVTASVDAGVVSINGFILKKDSTSSPGPAYYDTTYAISGTTYQLNVSGSSRFPSGSLQYGQNYPTFNDTNLIPSAVSISGGLSINFNNAMNADSVLFILDDNSGHTVSKKRHISGNQVTLSVTPAELASFSSTTNGSISVDMVKSTPVAVGTKVYVVTLEKRYSKLSVQFN